MRAFVPIGLAGVGVLLLLVVYALLGKPVRG